MSILGIFSFRHK